MNGVYAFDRDFEFNVMESAVKYGFWVKNITENEFWESPSENPIVMSLCQGIGGRQNNKTKTVRKTEQSPSPWCGVWRL
jgi:hypothetical protein